MNLSQDSYLFQGNHPDEASDAGDVGVVEAQQGKDGVGLQENSRGRLGSETVQSRDNTALGSYFK